MKKVKYTATALSQLVTFSDDVKSNISSFRRETVKLPESKTIISNFSNSQNRLDSIVYFLNAVYSGIDFSSRKDNFNNYNEFSSRLVYATYSANKNLFFEKLCRSFLVDISKIDGTAIEILDTFQDDELFQIIRNNTTYLILKLKQYRSKQFEESKKAREEGEPVQSKLFQIEKANEGSFDHNLMIVKEFEEVPYISGNSVRGYTKRLLMKDYLKHAEVAELPKSKYHQLFSGGLLNGAAGVDNINERLEFFKLCPPIHLLGTVADNKMLQGCLKVSPMRMNCLENGNGKHSFYEYLKTNFYTRSDGSKLETEIKLIDDMHDSVQMIYYFEELIKGTELEGSFVADTENELTLSCFARLIELWKENPYIGGKSSIGLGLLDLNVEDVGITSELYLKTITENKERIQEWLKGSK